MSGWDLLARLCDAGVPTFVAAGLVAVAVLVLLGGREASGARPAGGAGEDPVAPAGERPVSRPRRSLAAHLRPKDVGRRHAAESEVASALALLALAYRSGLPTWDVLDAVADGTPGPVATDLQQVAAALRWGATDSEAWTSVGPTWAPAARAVAVAHQAGIPPGPVLLAASDDLRGAELERLEVSAAKVGVRLVAPLGLVLLPAFCLTTVAPLVIALAGDLLQT